MRKVPVLLFVLCVALGATAAVVAGLERPPSDPPGLLPDGTVDPAKLPAFVGVVGPDGRDVICPDGKPLTVSRAELFAPPLAPGGLRPQVSDARSLAPRCGPGGHAVWTAIGE